MNSLCQLSGPCGSATPLQLGLKEVAPAVQLCCSVTPPLLPSLHLADLISSHLTSPSPHPLCCQTLITGVSQVGVDINSMVANPWRQGPLQFVPGLGPRKARALLAAVAASEDPFVKTRVDLLKQASCTVTVCSHASIQLAPWWRSSC